MGEVRYRYRQDNAAQFYIGFGVIMTLIIIWLGVFKGGGKMMQVIRASNAFWALSIVSVAIGAGIKWRFPKRFTWPEYILYGEWCVCVMCGLYTIMYSTSTNLVRKETWNGKAVSAYYQEAHTDERQVTDYDSEGNVTGTHTEYYPHSAEYGVSTTAGGYGGNSSIYTTFKNKWGNEDESWGSCVSAAESFSVYTTKDPGGEQALVPVALEHRYVNFVTASDSIKKLQGLINGYEDYIQVHPRSYSGPYGPTEFDRVVVAGAQVRGSWVTAVDDALDRQLVGLGPSKQCNIIIYVVGTSDQKCAHALEDAWKLGEKNKILDMGKGKEGEQRGIGNVPEFVQTVCDQIRLPSSKGGFERKPMSDYEYLISEISLPWWASMMIIIFGVCAQFGAAYLLIHNDIEA